jgi:hypothetical protein
LRAEKQQREMDQLEGWDLSMDAERMFYQQEMTATIS